MGTTVGAGKLNLHPCTDAEEAQNLQVLQQFITNNSVGTDAFTVKCSDTDTQDAFLLPSLTTIATRDTSADPLIGAELANPGADETVTLFFDSSAVPGYNPSGTYVFAIVDGVATFIDSTTIGGGGGGGSDDKTVKVTGTDTTSSYLYAAMEDTGTYDATTDVLVMAMVMHGGSDEKLREFVRIDSSMAGKIFNQITFDGATWDIDSLTLTIGSQEKVRWAYGTVTADSDTGTNAVTLNTIRAIANSLRPVSTDADTMTVAKWTGNLGGVAIETPSYKTGDRLIIFQGGDEAVGGTVNWTVFPISQKGRAGASGTYICTLSSDIAKSTAGASPMTSGTGTVSAVGQGGTLTPVGAGTRTIFNPWTCKVPASGAQYACQLTYTHDTNLGEDESDDEYTLTGPDTVAILYALAGAGGMTTLSIPPDGSGSDDIQWLGGNQCSDEE